MVHSILKDLLTFVVGKSCFLFCLEQDGLRGFSR
jgi:hypothetical protein